jgi:protein arginine kinase activator
MLCQKCGKAPATIHYKHIINGEASESHLCEACAAELGYEPIFSISGNDFDYGLGGMLSQMLGQSGSARPRGKVCPLCGATAEDISRSGRVGCSECYTVFEDMLTPFIRRIHGNTSHTGRLPQSADSAIKLRRRLDELKKELKKAVKEQEFERAAELRDEIRDLEDRAS